MHKHLRNKGELIHFIKCADLFICEGMYGEDEKKEKAIENKHMLFSEAATLASNGHVKELWLTHFSPSMLQPEDYLHMATSIFPVSRLGKDLMVKSLMFEI